MQKNRILLSLGLLAALSVGLIWFGLSQEVSPDSNAAPVSQAVPPTPVSQEETPDPADWRLCLVNPWHPLPEGYQPQLTQVENGHQVDSRCAADLEAMLADCRAAGPCTAPLFLLPDPGKADPALQQSGAKADRPGKQPVGGHGQSGQGGGRSRAPASTSWAWPWTLWTPKIKC